MTSPRPDTRLLVTSPITTDLSQFATDLTASGAGAYEDPSSRTALDGSTGRSIEIEAEINTTDKGWLVRHGENVASRPYGIKAPGSGDIQFVAGGATIATLTPPNVAAVERDYVIAWSTEPNPQTTGASNALRSEFLIYDVASSSLAWTTATHAVAAADDAGAVSIGGAWDGAALQQAYPLAVDSCRISSRFHTRTETREHFVAATTAPTVDGITAVEGPLVPGECVQAGGEPGGVYLAAAGAMQVGKNRHRLVSPTLRWLTPTTWTASDDLVDDLGAKWITEVDGGQTPITWLARRKIPRHTAYLIAEVQLATWTPGMGAQDDVTLTLYSSSTQPGQVGNVSSVSLTRNTDDGVEGLGDRERFDPLYLQRDELGYTWIYLAASVGGSNAAYSLRSMSAWPMSGGEAYDDDEPPNQWGS